MYYPPNKNMSIIAIHLIRIANMRNAIIFLGKALFLFISTLTLCHAVQPKSEIMVGSYIVHDHVAQPIVITNENNKRWSFANIETPENAFLTEVDCTNNTCTAAGAIELKSGGLGYSQRNPFLLLSTDNGKNWSWNKNITNLPKIYDGYTPSISCSEGYCSAAGFYQDNNGKTFPLLLSSIDGGKNWKYVNNIPSNITGSLGAVTCTNSLCVTIGDEYVKPTSKTLPLILTSKDHGLTWTTNKISGFSEQFNLIRFDLIKCHDNSCVAAGFAGNSIGTMQSLIITSQDKGKTWISKPMSELTKLEYLYPEDITYHNGSFIIVGGYSKPTGPMESLILVSNDNGNSFKLIKEFVNDNDNRSTWLRSISCSGNTCITGGDELFTGKKSQLNLLKSNDNSQTWSFISKTPSMYPFNIDRILCVNGHCTATGQTSTAELSSPILLSSDDNGNSWSVAKTIYGFPDNIYHINFSATAVN